METTELIEILARDEDTRHQFKANVTNETSLASEILAFSNTQGGIIVIGANDDGTICDRRGIKKMDDADKKLKNGLESIYD